MSVSLKTWNVPKLLFVWALNVAVFSGVASGVLDVRDVESMRSLLSEIAKEPGAGWPYIGLLTVVSIFNGAVSRLVKERLVFWPAPRPGSRAFSHFMLRDSTIDRKALRERFGPLPSDPNEQNALWAGWLNEFVDDPRVRSTYGLYLFARDWAAVAAATLVLAAPLASWLAGDTGSAVAYGAFLLVQFGIARQVARVQGEQLVMSVMACKGSSSALYIGDRRNGKVG